METPHKPKIVLTAEAMGELLDSLESNRAELQREREQKTHLLSLNAELLDAANDSRAEVVREREENARLRKFIAELVIDHSPLTEDDKRRGREIAKELGLENS